METDIYKKLQSWIRDNNLTYREITARTGIVPSNISAFMNNPDYGVTLPMVVRFLNGFADKEIIGYLFEEDPGIASAYMQTPIHKNILTDGDILQYVILFKDALMFLSDASLGPVRSIFYSMLTGNSCLSAIGDVSQSKSYISIKKAQQMAESDEIPLLLDDYIKAHFWDSALSWESIEIHYPEKNDEDYKRFLEAGETITWTDISAYVRSKRLGPLGKGKSTTNINSQLGLSSNVVFRLETTMTKSYKVSDIAKLDDYFNMGGKFIAMCLLATRTSMATDRLLSDITYDEQIIMKAITSFVRLFRCLEQRKEIRPIYEDFLKDYRELLSGSDEKRQELIDFIIQNDDLFPGRDPLKFFPYK